MYKVLYTHQKQKKRKTWHDGHLQLVSHRKAILQDENSKPIDSLFIKDGQLANDVELESEKFLIEVEYREDKENGSQIENVKNQADSKQVPKIRIFHSRQRKKQIGDSLGQGCGSAKTNSESMIPRETMNKKNIFEKRLLEDSDTVNCHSENSCSKFRTLRVNGVYNRGCDDSLGNFMKKSKLEIASSKMSNFNDFQNTDIYNPRNSKKFNSSSLKNLHSVNSNSISGIIPSQSNSPSNKRNSDEILALFKETDGFVESGGNVEENMYIDRGNYRNTVPNETDVPARKKKCPDTFFDDESQMLDESLFHDEIQNSIEIEDQLAEKSQRKIKKNHGLAHTTLGRWSANQSASREWSANWSTSGRWSANQSSIGPSVPQDTDVELSDVESSKGKFQVDLPRICNKDKRDAVIPQSRTKSKLVSKSNAFRTPTITNTNYRFPAQIECSVQTTPLRSVVIPYSFNSAMEYKQIMQHALKEHINILLFDVASKYYNTLSSVDVSLLSGEQPNSREMNVPTCKHGVAKLKAVRKEGKNNGRLFYSCPNIGENKCNLFIWFDEFTNNSSKNSSILGQSVRTKSSNTLQFKDPKSASAYFNSRKIELYCSCKFLIKSPYFKKVKSKTNKYNTMQNSKKSFYVVLPFKKASSLYNKEDIWIISKSLNFKPNETFIAKSVFYGPSTSCEVEVSPLVSFSVSNWDSNEICHAIHAFNVTTELTCIDNLEKNISSVDLPLLKSLLTFNITSNPNIYSRFNLNCLEEDIIESMTGDTVSSFQLNTDQARALTDISSMFKKKSSNSITLIHGVFGSGKSYLLSTVVLFLVQLFEYIESKFSLDTRLKLLIASTTNVAVDRVLTGLMDLGFIEFIRVGSLKKISKRILPYSIHASDQEDQELKELNDLMKSELSEIEKGYIRKALEQHKLGINREKLADIRVVGVTCAASVFPYLERLTFQVQLLDECSQMMEALSLLPIARFKCEKLVLVGDPNQLPPTIQGSESKHQQSLELTMFERLHKMGIPPVILRIQYRCHPLISNICSNLFYDGMLINGVADQQRKPLIDWLPTVSFFDVENGEEKCENDGSFSNIKEACFTVKLLGKILSCGIEPSSVGVITQYRSQVHKISTFLREANISLPRSDLKMIQISTVDAFQGAEKDIIILSCVRSNNVGFIDCPRRTNVALSRARRHLVVIGNHRLLKMNKIWDRVIGTCVNENTLFMEPDKFLRSIKIESEELVDKISE